MEKHSLRFLLVYCCFIVSSQNEAREAIAENGVKLQDSEIIEESLYYLNQFSALNADFNFADAKIVGFEKGDSNHVTATLDVNAECLQNIVCKSKVLKCQSSFENYEGLWVHLETTCNDEPLAVEETIQCEGCAVDLNLNAEGLSSLVETALHHIESETRRKPSLYYIARAQREVVNGFKYTLDLVLNGGHLNCKVVFLLKPWQNQNNHITSNNCTQSQEYVEEISNIRENQNALDNTLNPHYKPQLHDKDPTDNVPNFNLMAELGTVEITPDRLRDLESQIIPKDFEGQDPTIESSFNHPMVSSSSFQEVFATEDQPIVGVDQTETITSFTPDFDEEFIPTYADFATSSYPLNDFLNLGQFRGERSVGVLEKITGEDKPIVRDLADFAVSKLDNVGSNDRKRVVLEILGARKVKTRGTYYHIVLKIGVSHCHEDNPEPQCVNMLFEHLSKICKVQVHVDEDKSNPQLVKSQCQNTKRHNINKNRTTRDVSEKDHEIHLGKKTKVGSKDPHLKKYYKHVLDFFDSHSRYPQRFKVVEVLSAYVQIVGGVTYTMKVRVALSDCLKSDYKFVESCGVLAGGEKKVCDIEAYEQFSIVIDVNCRSDEKHETPPPSFGGIIDQPLDDPTALAYIKHSLEHLDSVSSETNKYKLKEVISVTKQVVAGYLWRIKARIVISNCAKTDPKRSSECGELSGKKPHVSNIKVWDKPGKKDPEITVTFEADGKEHVFKGNMGGIEVRKVNDPEAVEYVKKTLYDIDFASHKSFKYKLLEIISVTMQVVEGTLWRIRFRILPSECKKTEHKEIEKCGFLTGALPRVCNAEVWDRPWITRNGLNITVVCENENVPVRRKREVSEILGGVSKIDPKDSSLQKFYKYTLEYLDSVSTHVYRYKLVEVLSATQQVVAGMSYNLKVKIALSECLKTETKDLETCGILPNGENKVCDILGLDQPWISFAHVIVKCDQDEEKSFKIERDPSTRKYKIKSKRSIAGGTEYELRSKRKVGGEENVPIDDPEAAEYVKKTLDYINDISDKRNKYIVVHICSVTRQAVEGALWKIDFEVILSDCLKTDTKKIHECKPLLGLTPRICNAEIWDRPWIKPNGLQITATIIDDYEGQVFRSKRSVTKDLVGGKQKINPIDPTLNTYYEYSLNYLDSVSNHTYRYKFIQFRSADVQVVNGISYNMKAKIALSDCLKSDLRKNFESCNVLQNEKEKVCDIHALDQPGVLVTVIDLECQDDEEKALLTGGITALPLNDSTALKHIKKSIEDMDATSNQTNKYKLKEVLSVTIQVVAGFLYRIKANIILSSCPKTDPTPSSECNDLNAEPLIWNIIAWEKPEGGVQISITFETGRDRYVFKKDKKPGGIEDRPVNDPDAIKYVRNTLPHIDYASGLRNTYKVREILSVTVQAMEGSLWKISFKIVLSNCTKTDTEKGCEELEGATARICNAEIWDRPWMTPKSLKTIVVCAPWDKHPYRRKREVSGKHIEIETDSKTEKKKVTSKRSIASEELIRSKRSIAGGFENRSPAAVNYHNPIRHKIDVIYRGKTSEFNTKDHLKKKGYPKKYRSKYNTEILLSMFHEFMNKYNKKYVNRVEYKRRFDIFRKNMKFVQVLKKHEQGTAKYGMTQFADLSRKEFSKMLGYRTDLRNENELEFLQAQIPDVDLPDKFDWREKAAVSEVKNQGSCGSCWAFSVTGNVEGQYALKYGKLLEFSEQELVDCDTMDDGCGGGLMDNAYRMIEKLGGLEEEKDYPYEAENEKCHFNKSLAHVQLSGAVNISHDETDMAKWLVKNGPISIAINANAMQFYMGGVSHPWKFLCNPTSLDHGVLIVGYGEDRYPKFKKNLPYWIVKNSWGKRWGEQGYYRVYRGDGTCGVNQTPSSAIVA